MSSPGPGPAALLLLVAHLTGPQLIAVRPAAAAGAGGTGAIAFTRTEGDNQDIYRMNADGTEPVKLTTSTKADFGPRWSPDGTRIAFTSLRPQQAGDTVGDDVFVMNADGTTP